MTCVLTMFSAQNAIFFISDLNNIFLIWDYLYGIVGVF